MEARPFARMALLDASACVRALEAVRAHRQSWIQRHPLLPFFTLGAASYLDAEAGPKRYADLASALNPLLDREFGWLYEQLLAALARHLGAPATFARATARPGFHIFLPHPAFARPLGRIHFDLQFENIAWSEADQVDVSQPLSFTLAIRLPAAGAGLETWDIAKAQYDALPACEETRKRRIGPPRFVAYREGEIICHSGLILHRIAPARDGIRADDLRVTLQGHVLPGRRGYLLYW